MALDDIEEKITEFIKGRAVAFLPDDGGWAWLILNDDDEVVRTEHMNADDFDTFIYLLDNDRD